MLRTREERLAFAGSKNLFSTPFMREVYKDRKATEYVLRILTGKPALTVQENLTEHGTGRADCQGYARSGKRGRHMTMGSHLLCQSGADDESDVARLMDFFKSKINEGFRMPSAGCGRQPGFCLNYMREKAENNGITL